jgi:hypothetical protein
MNPDIGYNKTYGGIGSLGIKLSNETKNKISKSVSKSLIGNKRALGMKHSEETKKKMSKTRKGKTFTFSEEHKKNLSKALKDKKRKPRTDETKKRIGQANKNKKRTALHKCRVSLNKLKTLEKRQKWVKDLYFILDNSHLSANELLTQVSVSRCVVNRIRKGVHWVNNLSKEQCEAEIYKTKEN